MLVRVFVIFISVGIKGSPVHNNHNQSQLYIQLTENAPKSAPRPSNHDPVIVEVASHVYQILNLDNAKSTITVSGNFRLAWTDSRLAWPEESFDGITEMVIPSRDVWVPDMLGYYSHSKDKMLPSDNQLRVNHTGFVLFDVPFYVTTTCQVDLKLFPFDRQVCSLLFGAWTYREYEQKFHSTVSEAALFDYVVNQEWTLENTSVATDKLWYDRRQGLGSTQTGENYSVFVITLTMKRNSASYVLNLMLPNALVAFVAIVGFHTRGSSTGGYQAKFQLGIVTILSMSTILVGMGREMPKFSVDRKPELRFGQLESVSLKGQGGVPLIWIFNFALVCIVGSATITSQVFVSLERRSFTKPIPTWLLPLVYTTAKIKLARRAAIRRLKRALKVVSLYR